MKQVYSLGSHWSCPHLKFLAPDRMLNQWELVLLTLGFQTSSICTNTSINKGANVRKEQGLLIKYTSTCSCLPIRDCSRAWFTTKHYLNELLPSFLLGRWWEKMLFIYLSWIPIILMWPLFYLIISKYTEGDVARSIIHYGRAIRKPRLLGDLAQW